jgi:hypothetical protein
MFQVSGIQAECASDLISRSVNTERLTDHGKASRKSAAEFNAAKTIKEVRSVLTEPDDSGQ